MILMSTLPSCHQWLPPYYLSIPCCPKGSSQLKEGATDENSFHSQKYADTPKKPEGIRLVHLVLNLQAIA
ncbi:hypothetical protein CPter91_0563 [Collimonas pratensis]|uniref:Uncharacterized protein n=1 Tax=Collimonas pratensis TaxID=279113 RepID=A0A127PYT8_9BURK|nr:hypothetical protein CPter91_0563 [Collimonas pratensis]